MSELFEGIYLRTPFRDYQQRILSSIDLLMSDNKLHISAAPGAGKTILGLEVIRRLGKKALIFVPTINLRNQWKERFLGSFIGREESEAALRYTWENEFSVDIMSPGVVTCATYQALFTVYSKDDGSFAELINKYKEMGIETICLDEAHHLKREWWKALTDLVNAMDIRLIALTATPPMDTSDIEWKRYIELCGDIDAEISIPEMVARKCLCPHQDYIYICSPTQMEDKKVSLEVERNRQCETEILRDRKLYYEIKHLPCLINPSEHMESLLKFPDYLSHLLSYAAFIRDKWQVELEEDRFEAEKAFNAWDNRIVQRLNEISKEKTDIESFFLPLMKDILQNVPEHFSEELRQKLTEILTGNHLMIRGRMTDSLISEEVNKTLRNSASKLNAIDEIIKKESSTMGDSLRCLILMDYIRKEDMSKVEKDESLTDIGVSTVFERLRRQEHMGNLEKYLEIVTEDNPKEKRVYRQRLGVLTGSMVILPEHLMQQLAAELEISTVPKPLGITGYSVYDGGRAEDDRINGIVSEYFREGRIEILIGTAALLGEGWDQPAVNTLIIGSTSSMYVKTNQMRGRALRVDKDQPEKVSHIWHLMTSSDSVKNSSEEISMRQRFDATIGLSQDGTRIESGIGRMLSPGHVMSDRNSWNEWMLKQSENRDTVRMQWLTAAENYGRQTVRDVVDISAGRYKVSISDRINRNALSHGQLKKIAEAVKNALLRTGQIRGGSIHTGMSGGSAYYFLESVSERDSMLYAKSLRQSVMPLDSPKYIVEFGIFVKKYIAVPDALALRKENAQVFSSLLGGKLIYVYTNEGKKILLNQKLRQRSADRDSIKMVKKLI